ncbi:DASH family cryptochrome [Jejudonia soesokkakensis]|uniref:Cryptochrome DASH n=1 Tax=Jejudonia soesokkakensis TaxID=1323432 RepID=A0ABW2MU68_9FLAO
MNHLVWFRNDLRTYDNTVLSTALKDANKVIAAYCFDPRHYLNSVYGFKKTDRFRSKFLIETIQNLKENLAALNIPMFIYTEKPEDCLPKLISQQQITSIYFQKEWTSEEAAVEMALKTSVDNSIQFKSFYDQFLFHPEDIPFDAFSKIPNVYTDFRKKCEKYCFVREMLPQPEKLSEDNFIDTETNIPTLQQLGLEAYSEDTRTAFSFSGGEDPAWERIHSYFWKTEQLATYKQTRNGLVGTEYSSKLSAWLANGSISSRSIYWEVKKFEKNVVKNQDTYWLVFELIWRDFFKYISLKHGNSIFKIGGILQKSYNWNQSKKQLDNWILGNTTYDFVNANMSEIEQTGWMSNRGRQNVASFWAKELKQDWRIGAAYFESMLIDYDVHSNWGNWMYVAGVGNDPRDRKFNINSQAERYDPENIFIDLWNNEHT